MENKYFRGILKYGGGDQPELKNKLNKILIEKELLSEDSTLGFYFDYCYYIQDKRIKYYKRPPKDDMEEVSFEYFQKWLLSNIEPQYEIY